MPARLRSLGEGAKRLIIPEEEEVEQIPEQMDFGQVLDILALLRQRTGHDFSHYKRPTLLRRIARRLQVHQVPNLTAYVSFLREHPDESPALLRDLLITVTNFFRDHEAFDALEREVVPKLFAGKRANDSVRVWVVGCATGEEAYSLAMLLSEYASRLADPPSIQIFATDIDEAAIAEARECRYPNTIALDVSAERLRRFFIREDENYRVKKEIREWILFTAHNVLRDPPFSKLDLVSCRNLLIYLNHDMQEQVLSTFHFALLPERYLFLGTSESAEGVRSLFFPADKKHHIYTRRAAIASFHTMVAAPQVGEHGAKSAELAVPGVRLAPFGEQHHRVVEQLAPPSCLVNEVYDVVHMSEHAGRYFRFPGGELSRNLLAVVRPEMRLDLHALLLAAKAHLSGKDGASQSRRIHLEIDGKPAVVAVSIRRVTEGPAQTAGYFLVIFDEISETAAAAKDEQSDGNEARLEIVAHLEQELQAVRDQLHLTVEQYETSTEELKASNEELQAINEELRSNSEELETSKEELQSLNEELTTVNQELREKIEELGRVNSDLQNLMSSTDIGTVFLDRGLQIRRYTARAQELFNITPRDIGRPLEHFTHKLDYTALTQDAEAVLETLHGREREVRSADGCWYLARLLPYRTIDDKVDGIVLNFVDITVHRQAEELRRRAAFLEEQTRILGLANVLIFGLDGRITIWNQGCERLYGYSKEEAVGRIAHELLGTVFPLPLAELKAQLLRTGAWDGELSHVKRDGERVTVASRWVLHRNENGEPSAILEANHDISERTRAEETLRQADRRKDEFLAMLAHELRNPLAAMQSCFELLNDPGDGKKSMRRARGVMDRQLKLLIRLVDDLLDIERLVRGKIALRKERIDVATVVEAALETTRPLIEAYRHTLVISLPAAPLYLDGDRSRLAQVLGNLVHNAAKYTPPGGRIELSVSAEDKAAVMRVHDNGIGIPAEVVPHIFEYFAQEAPSSESIRQGLGVGLALARQLVELHQGTIHAESGGRGKGSEFTMRIPLTATPSVDAAAAAVAPIGLAHALTPRKVLVIDDDHDVADALAGVLRNSGHQVWTTYSGHSGLQMALEHRPYAALVDIAMPDMDGYEAARRLREQLPGILLIAVTGLVQKSDRVRVHEAGFNYHVAKPASASQIEELLATAALPSA